MSKYNYTIYTLVLLLVGCKSIDFLETQPTTTVQEVQLGNVISGKEFILQKAINNAAIPSYKESIKLSVLAKAFTKKTYKAFIKAKTAQVSNTNIHYVDSILDKTRYLQLQIADKVSAIIALNSIDNNAIKDYLSHNSNTQFIKSVSIVLNQKDFERIIESDAVFLVEKSLKTYGLQLYNDGAKTETIALGEGVVFEYKGANCCWQENKKRQLEIVDLVGIYNDCPNKTYRSARRAKKNDYYSKLWK